METPLCPLACDSSLSSARERSDLDHDAADDLKVGGDLEVGAARKASGDLDDELARDVVGDLPARDEAGDVADDVAGDGSGGGGGGATPLDLMTCS